MDQLSRILTHVNVNMIINFIFDLWQEKKSKLYCQSLCIALFYLFIVKNLETCLLCLLFTTCLK